LKQLYRASKRPWRTYLNTDYCRRWSNFDTRFNPPSSTEFRCCLSSMDQKLTSFTIVASGRSRLPHSGLSRHFSVVHLYFLLSILVTQMRHIRHHVMSKGGMSDVGLTSDSLFQWSSKCPSRLIDCMVTKDGRNFENLLFSSKAKSISRLTCTKA